MRVGLPFLPTGTDQLLRVALLDFFRLLVNKLDGLSTGRIAAVDNAATAMPTTGTFARGDFVRNATPSILGVAASRYVITGWTRITDGSAHVAGTDWAETRTLTGT
jgi:hypothetical protein